MSFPARFHNTVGIQGSTLNAATQKVLNCAESIMSVYLAKRRPYTPSQVLNILVEQGGKWDRNTIRARITDLTKAGHLLKTDKQQAINGSLEFFWSLHPSKYPSALDGEQSKMFEQ